MSRRRAVTPVVALVLCGALSGCSDHAGSPKPLAPATSSATPSPTATSRTSPSPSVKGPPTMPAAARGTSKASAEAFVRHYVGLINYAMFSGDTKPMLLAALRQCTTCRAVASSIDDLYGRAGHVQGDGWQVRRITFSEETKRGARIQLRIWVPKQVLYANSTAEPSTSTMNAGNLTFYLERSAYAWTVAQFDADE
jgi:hypothetical protein